MKKLRIEDLIGVKGILSKDKMKHIIGGYGGGNCGGVFVQCGPGHEACCEGYSCIWCPLNDESTCGQCFG